MKGSVQYRMFGKNIDELEEEEEEGNNGDEILPSPVYSVFHINILKTICSSNFHFND